MASVGDIIESKQRPGTFAQFDGTGWKAMTPGWRPQSRTTAPSRQINALMEPKGANDAYGNLDAGRNKQVSTVDASQDMGRWGRLEKLYKVQRDERGDPAVQPARNVTHCNLATVNIVDALLGGNSAAAMDLKKSDGRTPQLANDMYNSLARSKNWRSITPEEAQTYANNGILVVASWANPFGHGHIATVSPAPNMPKTHPASRGTNTWINHIGQHVQEADAHYAFDGHENDVKYYIANP